MRRLPWNDRFMFTFTVWVPCAVVTWPKAASPIFVLGRSNHGVLLRLNDSARNSVFNRSLRLNLRKTDASMLNKRGPCKTFRPTLPIVGIPLTDCASENAFISNQYSPGPVWPRILIGPLIFGRLLLPGAFKLVDGATMSSGNPLSQVQRPLNCQPPRNHFGGPVVAQRFPW